MFYMELPFSPKVARVTREAIKEAGKSEREIARKAGLTPSKISLRLNGTYPFRLEELALVALALDMRPSELMRRVEDAA